MHIRTSRLLLPALVLLASAAACGEDDPPSLAQALTTDLQAILDTTVADEVAPGVVLHVARGDGARWSGTSGIADVTSGATIAADDRFRAGSILKTFVAVAALQQVESGELGYDDLLTDHLPTSVTDRVPNAGAITVRMLLAHRSGLFDWAGAELDAQVIADPAHVFTLDEILTIVADQEPAFAPGTEYGYSNTNYTLLGAILESVTGLSFREVVRRDVFARAGLNESSLPEPGNRSCEGCARGYIGLEIGLVDFTEVDPSMAGAAGGHALVTTAEDLARFLRALLRGELFEKAGTLEEMRTFLVAEEPDAAQTGYGFGLSRHEVDGVEVYGHLGGTAGYQSFVLYAPETDLVFAGTMNAMGDLGAFLVPIVLRVGAE